MRNRIRQFHLIIAAAAFLLMNTAGCAIHNYRDSEETLRLGRAGVAVLVDSSVHLSVSGGRNSISVPENASISVEMLKAVEASLERKGYAVSGPRLLSVGAAFNAADTMNVTTVGGVLESPEEVGKPFIVRPDPGDPAAYARLNELFLWARKVEGPAPKSSLGIASAPGLVLVSCSGSNKQSFPAGGDQSVSITRLKPGVDAGSDAWSEMLVMLLDRASGRIAWLGRGSVTEFTPEAAGKEVLRLVSEMPPAN